MDHSIKYLKRGDGRGPFQLTPSEAQFYTPQMLPPPFLAKNDPSEMPK